MSNFPHLSSILNDHLENDNNQSSLLKESKVFKNEIRSSYEEMHEKNTHSEMPTEAEENECTNAASLSLSSPEIKHEGKMPSFPFNAEFNRVNDPLLSKDSEVFEDEKQSSNDSEMHENNTSSCHIGLEAKKSHQDEKKECTDDSMHCLSSPERVLERKILQIRIRKIDSFEPEEVSMLLISNNDKQTGRCEEKQDVCIRQSSMVCSDQNVGKEHEREIHECRVCKKQCQSKFYLSVHLITHMDDVMVGKNDSRKFKCDLCAEKFVTNSLLQEHIICTHTEQRPLLCGFCSKTFASKNDFVEHSRSHVIPKPFRCHICPRGFRGKQILLAHINSHTGEKPFVCDICPKRYPHKKGLLCHKKYKHSSSRPFVCHICGKGYPLIGGLNEHVKIHNKDKPYVCEICGKQFTIIQQLTSHTNQHTEERPYKCQECESSFKFRHHLVSHMKTHATEKEFACDICNRSFTRAFGLKIHKLRHSDIKSLCCDMCDKVFSSYSGLYVHKSHHTGKKPHECDVCGKTFYQKQALQIHLRVHTGEKPYSCNLCNKTFTRPFGRDKHMRVHKGEKPHVCDICGHRCIEKHNLRAHIKRVHQMSD